MPCPTLAWVLHPKFGEGIVLNFEGVGQQSRVQIQFDDVGANLAFLPLLVVMPIVELILITPL